MVFQKRLVFKDFRIFAEKYNFENAITSRHLYARCQEWCRSNDNLTQISKMPKIWKKSLEYEFWYFKYDYFFMDFRNSAEKYNIKNAITARHQHARCQ